MKGEHNKKSGTVYRHIVSENLDRNAYSTHIHNVYEILYFVEGDATHVIEDRKYKLKKGDLIFIRPFQYHFIQIDSTCRYERYDILFDKSNSLIGGIDLFPKNVDVINILGNSIALDIFKKFDIYKQNSSNEVFEGILPHLLSELLYSIYLFSKGLYEKSVFVSPLISASLKFINDNIYTIRDVKEISDALFVSESYLFRLFRNELHQSPKKYIREKRLLLAQNMIISGISPTEACEKSGFIDYTTFYRNYCDFFGHSPQKTVSI